MIYSNVYENLTIWLGEIIEIAKTNENIVTDVFVETMPAGTTEGILISKLQAVPTENVYINGDMLLQFKFTLRSIQTSYINDNIEKMNLSQFLDKVADTALSNFNNGNQPPLEIGYKSHSIEIANSSSLQTFDVDKTVYAIDINFNFYYKKQRSFLNGEC